MLLESTQALRPARPGLPLDPEAARHVEAVETIIRHFRQHLQDEINLEELAAITGYSKWHLDRVFSRVTGVPPISFLTLQRIEAAKRLLLSTDSKIIDICYEVGYRSLGSFGKRFTQLCGMPPNVLRTAARNFDPARFLAMAGMACERCRLAVGNVSVGAAGLPGSPGRYILFVGAFPRSTASNRPLACGLRDGFGSLSLNLPPRRKVRLMSVAFPIRADGEDLLMQDETLRGSVEATPEDGRHFRIVLAEPALHHPPLLPVFPLLLESRMKGLLQ